MQKALTMEDIIFANRNQEYGAYMLRKNSNKRIIHAFLLTSSIVASIFIFTFFNKSKPENKTKEIFFNPVSVEKVDKNTYTPPPPPPVHKILQELGKQAGLGAPVVVDSILEYPELQLPANPIPIENAGITGTVEYIDNGKSLPDVIDIKKPYIKVEEEATFKGGTITDFRTWVAKHIVFPEEASVVDMHGKVVIQFVVNTEGKVEDLKILKGVDDLLDQEAFRVIANSPEWKPARQQGVKVKQLFVIPINFQLKNNM
jgi:protein TonB